MGEEYTEWEIYRMRQRYYEIKNYINQYYSMIDDNNRELSNIRKRVDELQKIKSNLKRTTSKFESYVSVKLRKYEVLRNNFSNTKFAKDCSEEMLSFIKGRETSMAMQNIENAIYEVNNKANKLSYDIDELTRDNNRLRNKIADLEYEKRVILQKGVI